MAFQQRQGITREMGSALLHLLRNLTPAERDELPNLPVDFRTITFLPKLEAIMQPIEGGNMIYFGIEFILNCPRKTFFDRNVDTVQLAINVDGLPLKQSSSSQVGRSFVCH